MPAGHSKPVLPPHGPRTEIGEAIIRVIAIDWSGAKSGERKKIWLAEVRDGTPARLEDGRSRGEVIGHLAELAKEDADLVVGLDFVFSLPAWFLEKLGVQSSREAWRRIGEHGEQWLEQCESPFWGRKGKQRPSLPAHLRATDREAAEQTGMIPKSVFQIAGAGAVGTGSIRGIPHLLRLANAGFSIWPFDEPSRQLVV